MTIAGDTHVGKSQKGQETQETITSNETLWYRLSHEWLLLVIVLLTATGAFGLGLLAHAQMGTPPKGDGLWIENLAPEVMKGAVSAPSTPVSETIKKAVVVPAVHTTQSAAVVISIHTSGEVVAAKTGKSYYPPSCGSVKRIKEENKVWFKSAAEAQAAGYTASKSCKGS